jgi:hypothetical protein
LDNRTSNYFLYETIVDDKLSLSKLRIYIDSYTVDSNWESMGWCKEELGRKNTEYSYEHDGKSLQIMSLKLEQNLNSVEWDDELCSLEDGKLPKS